MRHQPAHRLDDEVVAGPVGRGPVRPVPGDREVDEAPGSGASSVVVVEAEAREPTGPEVLDEDVARDEQASQHLGPLRAGGGRAAALRLLRLTARKYAAVRVPAASLADPGRAPAAGRIALGRLDLDDVRAEIAEEHRAVRAGEDRRAVDDPQAGERSRGGAAGRGEACRSGSVGSAITSMVAPRILAA